MFDPEGILIGLPLELRCRSEIGDYWPYRSEHVRAITAHLRAVPRAGPGIYLLSPEGLTLFHRSRRRPQETTHFDVEAALFLTWLEAAESEKFGFTEAEERRRNSRLRR